MWNEKVEKIKEYIKSEEKNIINLWERFVNTHSGTLDVDCVKAFGQMCLDELETIGAKCEILSNGNKDAYTLLAILGEERTGKPVLISAHLDTVFRKNDFPENPFRIEDGIAYGPGVIDNKGGIVMAIYIMKALEHIGYKERPIKLILSGDEELGHKFSGCKEVYLKEAKDCICAFNLEAGQADNRLCIGRKGKLECSINVSGVGAHAAHSFENGKNAILEMAHKIMKLQEINDEKKGIMVNVGTVRGGTISNVVPESCSLEVDIRYKSEDDYHAIKERIKDVCNESFIGGTTATVEFEQSFPPFETTISDFELYERASDVSNRLGFGHVGGVTLNGGSDSAYISRAGIPVICAFGVQGKKNHTKKEYAMVDSLFNRAIWISSLILDLEETV